MTTLADYKRLQERLVTDRISAIAVERERCALIAEELATVGNGEIYVARKIADAIRRSPEDDL